MLFVGIVHTVLVARLSRSDEADAVRISAASAFSLGPALANVRAGCVPPLLGQLGEASHPGRTHPECVYPPLSAHNLPL